MENTITQEITDKRCKEEITKMLSSKNWKNYYEENLTPKQHLEVLEYNKRVLSERDRVECQLFDKSIHILKTQLSQQSLYQEEIS